MVYKIVINYSFNNNLQCKYTNNKGVYSYLVENKKRETPK